MKAIVGIVAAAFFTACGVGMDDPEGEAAAGIAFATQSSALTAASQGQQSDDGTLNTTTVAPGTPSNAPQDPIPAMNLRPTRPPPVPGLIGPRPSP